jgi:hypothetical protein
MSVMLVSFLETFMEDGLIEVAVIVSCITVNK